MKNIYKFIFGTLAATLIVALSASAATIFTPSQGGSGTGTKPQAGQVLIGTTGRIYAPAYLTAGSNITITTSSGAITIASTASGGGSTTTINGVTGPTFTFNVSGSNGLSYSTSTGVVTLTQTASSDSVPGYLSAADHTTFNAKVGGSGASSQVAVFSGASTVTSYSGLTFNNASGTLVITGPAGTSTLTVGTSTKPACQQTRDSDDAGWTKSYWKGGILFVENSTCP
jgi:hypothetical protein